MKEDYLITIVTKQESEGESEVTEMTALADYRGNDDDYYIIYADEETDNTGSVTTLHVENGKCITVFRDGTIQSHMIIEKDVRHVSHNVTPYGTFSLGVCAIDVDSHVRSGRGTLHFKYATDIDMRPVGEIEFDIKLCPRGALNQSQCSL